MGREKGASLESQRNRQADEFIYIILSRRERRESTSAVTLSRPRVRDAIVFACPLCMWYCFCYVAYLVGPRSRVALHIRARGSGYEACILNKSDYVGDRNTPSLPKRRASKNAGNEDDDKNKGKNKMPSRKIGAF